MLTLIDLLKRRSKPARPGDAPLDHTRADLLMPLLPGWLRTGGEIHKTFAFKSYYETIAFVNALAFIAHREDHHPDLEVGYAKVRVRYSTHAVNGLSENDFICAAKVETLLDPAWTDARPTP
jgi:4a-hydroxytetrahydrobiopterin dehydratase